mmetsp:Transcript_997/g.2380  ORF Transcript_997/g.2380 Transcript_997/m.2380 type:complete len:225 (+) Transcript_997:281-955(+)
MPDLELDALRLEGGCGLSNIVHKEANVPKAFVWLRVPIVVAEVWVVFRAVVVGQLEHGDTVWIQGIRYEGASLIRFRVWRFDSFWKCREKVEREVVEVPLTHQCHTELPNVKLETLLRVLHSHHCLSEAELGCSGTRCSRNDLDPIAVRVIRECDTLHTSFVRLFLKLDTFPCEFFAGSIHVIDCHRQVPEPIPFSVSGVVYRSFFCLGSIVMRQLDGGAVGCT